MKQKNVNFDELRVRLDDERFEGQSSVAGVAGVGKICRVCFGMHLKPKLKKKKKLRRRHQFRKVLDV
jgi:hypothetical protein